MNISFHHHEFYRDMNFLLFKILFDIYFNRKVESSRDLFVYDKNIDISIYT